MACGCDDEKIYKEEICSGSNNELTNVVVQDGSSAECSDEWIRFISPTNNTISTKQKIQKIPRLLRLTDNFYQKYYHPQVISIGPYHHGKKALKPMEKIKIRLTREFISNCKGTSAYSIYNTIAGLAAEARKCYADDDDDKGSTHHFDNKEFARMMVLDGCFLLHFIFCMVEGKGKELKLKHDEVCYIANDLLLLENQLPLIVLKALMSFTSFGETQGLQMIKKFVRLSGIFPPPPESCLEKFENFIVKFRTFIANHIKCPKSSHEGGDAREYKDDEPAHLLELFRRGFIDSNAFETETVNPHDFWYSYRSARELRTAGIVFRPNRSKHNLLTDVRYEPLIVGAILRLPVITIDPINKSLLLNLVAYEKCPDSPNDFGISSYLWLMDMLIDHPDDVKELRRRGIILNCLASDEEVATLFNEIDDMLVPNPNAFVNVKSKIEKHYKNKVKVWITEFLHTHFSTPWAALAFMGAIVALALSFIQSYYAIKPRH